MSAEAERKRRFVNVVAVSLSEAKMLAADGLHHGSIDEANAALREIRKTADPFYANQYCVFSVEVHDAL